MNRNQALVIVKENLDRLRERRNKAAVNATRVAHNRGQRCEAADRVAEAHAHWVEEMELVESWILRQIED